MKNFKLLFMIVSFSAGLVANSQEDYEAMVNRARLEMESTQNKEVVTEQTEKSQFTFADTIKEFTNALFDNSFQEKLDAFKKTLSDEQLSSLNLLSKKDKEESVRDLYFKENPPTRMETIAGATLFTAVVGGFLAYSYAYSSTDEDSEEDTKN